MKAGDVVRVGSGDIFADVYGTGPFEVEEMRVSQYAPGELDIANLRNMETGYKCQRYAKNLLIDTFLSAANKAIRKGE